MLKNMFRAAVCMTTHNRIDCARINQEIIKFNYRCDWVIVHACSNHTYEKYLEDELIHCEPLPMTSGALNLLKRSIARAADVYHPDYFVHLEGDTWILDHQVLLRYIQRLNDAPSALIAASSWSIHNLPGWQRNWAVKKDPASRVKSTVIRLLPTFGVDFAMLQSDTISTQFFIAKNTAEFVAAIDSLKADDGYNLENGLYKKIVERSGVAAIIGMPEREPVHPHHRWVCEALSLYGQHWPTSVPNIDIPGKRETLKAFPALRGGPHMKRLLETTDLSYYNVGANRTAEL
jgi:hypothetical protein